MIYLPQEDPDAPGPLAFLRRLVVGAASLAIILALLAFAWVALIVLAVLLAGAAIWVRYKAAKVGLPWRVWLLQAGMARAGRPQASSPFEAAVREAADEREHTIEGEYAVLKQAPAEKTPVR